jgi:phosphotransferase system HPr (HPr) family protein
MVKEEPELHKVAFIKNELGLHARSAAQIAAIARNSKGNVWLMKDGEKADASSIMDILMLVCEKGTKIRIIIEDSADTDILNAIVDLVDNGFGE